MKINCRCGSLIVDGADDLPHKGHLVPDQEWLSTCDALDGMIDATAGRRIAGELAHQRVREIVSRAARLMWQCRVCGRLYIDGLDRRLRCFVPEGEPIDREVLRSRPS